MPTRGSAARRGRTGARGPAENDGVGVLPYVGTDAALGPNEETVLRAAVIEFADKGFQGATTRGIATRAGLSSAAVYVHYRSKGDLLYEVVHRAHVAGLRELQSAFARPGSAADRVRRVVVALVRFNARWREHAHVGNFELSNLAEAPRHEITAIRHETQALVREAVRMAVEEASADQSANGSADVDAAATVILSLAIDVSRWFRSAKHGSADDLAHSYANLISRMLRLDDIQPRSQHAHESGERMPEQAAHSSPVACSDVATQTPMSSSFTVADDFSVHQVAQTLEVSGGGEPEWFEHDTTVATPPGLRDRPYVLNWFQFHPNKQNAQAWIMLNDGQTQYNIVLRREGLPADRRTSTIGPLTFEVVEPLRLYRTRLAPDDRIPFSYDFTLRARHIPKLFDKRTYHDEDSAFQVEHCHTDQGLVCVEGSLTYRGSTFDMTGYQAYRDHCWGRRAGPHRRRGFHVPLLAQFNKRTLSMWYEELTDGTPLYAVGHIASDDGVSVQLRSFQHTCELDSDSGDLRRLEWSLVDEIGRDHTLTVNPLYPGGYQRYSDVLAERLHHSGAVPVRPPGAMSIDVQSLDLTDPATVHGTWAREQRQQYCEFVLDGERGFGTCIYYVSPDHVRYGQQLRLES